MLTREQVYEAINNKDIVKIYDTYTNTNTWDPNNIRTTVMNYYYCNVGNYIITFVKATGMERFSYTVYDISGLISNEYFDSVDDDFIAVKRVAHGYTFMDSNRPDDEFCYYLTIQHPEIPDFWAATEAEGYRYQCRCFCDRTGCVGVTKTSYNEHSDKQTRNLFKCMLITAFDIRKSIGKHTKPAIRTADLE